METNPILRKIERRKMCLAIVGLGYVGLPTAALFAEAGFNVIGLDVKREIVEAVNEGNDPLKEPGLHALIKHSVEVNRLRATLDFIEALSQADGVIVSVQTPIDEKKSPNMSFFLVALEEIASALRREMLVVVSSTVPPGMVVNVVKPLLESASTLKADKDFYLAYAPERIAPGKALSEFAENPRLIGGIGPNSTILTKRLFGTICRTIIATDASSAEVAKLAENTFRDVNIAFANELALLCENLQVDVLDVIRLANTHPRVKIHHPGAGVGGPCLPKDPYILLHSVRTTNLDSKVIMASRHINDCMPSHIVKFVVRGLSTGGKNIKNSKIAILGTAYKEGAGSSIFSPSEKVIKKLLILGGEVVAYDPYCEEFFGAKRAKELKEAARNADCLTIMVNHPDFRRINLDELKKLMKKDPVLVDGSRAIDPHQALQKGFRYYGIGWGSSS
jgi:UDP-N-acetyl-D-mannosaminuronic acid dehydrogenase